MSLSFFEDSDQVGLLLDDELTRSKEEIDEEPVEECNYSFHYMKCSNKANSKCSSCFDYFCNFHFIKSICTVCFKSNRKNK